mgnify:CR=1 FL=1
MMVTKQITTMMGAGKVVCDEHFRQLYEISTKPVAKGGAMKPDICSRFMVAGVFPCKHYASANEKILGFLVPVAIDELFLYHSLQETLMQFICNHFVKRTLRGVPPNILWVKQVAPE